MFMTNPYFYFQTIFSPQRPMQELQMREIGTWKQLAVI